MILGLTSESLRWPIAMRWHSRLSVNIINININVNIFFSRTTGPGGDNFEVNIVNLMYFSRNLLYFRALIRQTKFTVMMTVKVITKIVNFMTFRAGVLVLGCGHISHIVKTLTRGLQAITVTWVSETQPWLVVRRAHICITTAPS